MTHKLRQLGVGIDQTLRKLARMTRRVANAFDTINFTHVFEQHREVCRIAFWRHTPIGIDILSEQRHLTP